MRRGTYTTLRWIAIVLLFVTVIITVFQLVRYSRLRSSFPPGTIIAGIPVGGLDSQQTADRLLQAYNIPLELQYGDAFFQVKPSSLGFTLNLETMITAADIQRTQQPFWSSFWDYLWNRMPTSMEIPLSAEVSQERLVAYLQNEVAARYDQLPAVAQPIPGSAVFSPGEQGRVLNIERSAELIESALFSPAMRKVKLAFDTVNPSRPGFQNLETLLKQIIDLAGYDGLSEIYIQELNTGQELHFAYSAGQEIPVDIAFSAASSIKIPVMVSVFRRLTDPAPADVITEIERMIERSDNVSTDTLMQTILDRNLGPLSVTSDMTELGYKNTFIVGYFYQGAPLLRVVTTKANSRTDINTNPDRYNQTTPAEIGMLLQDIYQCAQNGGGALTAVFDGEITKRECQLMLDYLSKNKNGVLLQAGLPDGAHFAHKHGWITEYDGLMHSISDAGIVFTPGGNYIITIYLYHPTQIVFDPINRMVAQLSSAVYNYFDLSGQ